MREGTGRALRKAYPTSCFQPRSRADQGPSRQQRGQSQGRGSCEGRYLSPQDSVGGQPRWLIDIRAGECGGSSARRIGAHLPHCLVLGRS